MRSVVTPSFSLPVFLVAETLVVLSCGPWAVRAKARQNLRLKYGLRGEALPPEWEREAEAWTRVVSPTLIGVGTLVALGVAAVA